jgi:heme-degrading monooxygenase HmoA
VANRNAFEMPSPLSSGRMILRVLTARVSSQNSGRFNELLRTQLVELRGQPGLVYVKLARRLDEDQTEEVVLIEEWRTPSDLFEWTSGRLNRPRLLPGTEELVENLVITHYEALDVSPEDLQLRVLGIQGNVPVRHDDVPMAVPAPRAETDGRVPGVHDPVPEADEAVPEADAR